MTVDGNEGLSTRDPGDPSVDVFEHVVCSVGTHDSGYASIRLVERLRPPEADVVLVGAVDTLLARRVRAHAPEAYTECLAAVQGALDQALVLAPTARTRILDDSSAGALLWAANDEDASLIAVEDVPASRLAGIVLGTVTTVLLHEARCSVLVARPPAAGTEVPRSIVVGVDGSRDSVTAALTAAGIARRCSASLRVLAATGGTPLDPDGLAATGLEVETVDAGPVEALVDAAQAADLLVVGSRGLHGIRALGSVSELVAHRAPCSILVVRTPREAPLLRGADAGVRCRDVMTKDVVVVVPDTPIAEAARLMVLRGVDTAVVVDGGAPVGLLTEAHLALLVGSGTARGADLEAARAEAQTRPVSSIMTTPAQMVDADAAVEQVARRLVDARSLPVLEEGKLVGTVSERDLLRALVGNLDGGAR